MHRKNDEKKRRFGGTWGGGFLARAMATVGSWDPLFIKNQKATAQLLEHLLHALAQSAVADIILYGFHGFR